ncbi:uncharacterized protein JCM15063_003319 [Sporobolomyces koalae]|uniref:uncharacterized protein n=1 Tax=Sporobolomyces koalae TaxID=500713 RepID=UPI0031772CBC
MGSTYDHPYANIHLDLNFPAPTPPGSSSSSASPSSSYPSSSSSCSDSSSAYRDGPALRHIKDHAQLSSLGSGSLGGEVYCPHRARQRRPFVRSLPIADTEVARFFESIESLTVRAPGRVKQIDTTRRMSQQDPPPCNTHYLRGRCATGAKCRYGHEYELNAAQIEEIRRGAKWHPCSAAQHGLECAEGDACIYGHGCPKGINCRKADCAFNADVNAEIIDLHGFSTSLNVFNTTNMILHNLREMLELSQNHQRFIEAQQQQQLQQQQQQQQAQQDENQHQHQLQQVQQQNPHLFQQQQQQPQQHRQHYYHYQQYQQQHASATPNTLLDYDTLQQLCHTTDFESMHDNSSGASSSTSTSSRRSQPSPRRRQIGDSPEYSEFAN